MVFHISYLSFWQVSSALVISGEIHSIQVSSLVLVSVTPEAAMINFKGSSFPAHAVNGEITDDLAWLLDDKTLLAGLPQNSPPGNASD